MDLGSITQVIITAATPHFSGRPRFITAAIRRSAVVAAMGMRARAGELPIIAAAMGTAAVFMGLSRELLETRGICEEQLSHWMWTAVVGAYALFLMAITCPVWRRIKWLF
jgi:hypothetical protein